MPSGLIVLQKVGKACLPQRSDSGNGSLRRVFLSDLGSLLYHPGSFSLRYRPECNLCADSGVLGLQEKIDTWTSTGIVVALFGLVLLTLRGGEATYREWWGDFLTALGAFAYAVQIVLVEKFSQEDTLPLVTAEMATVTCLSLMLFLVSGNRNLSLSFSQWLSIGFLGVVATALTFTVQKLAQKHTPAIHAGLIFISEPVFAAFFSYFLWQERFTSAAVAGCIFILLGILLPQIRTLVIPDAPLPQPSGQTPTLPDREDR